jgi:hypothetical protein
MTEDKPGVVGPKYAKLRCPRCTIPRSPKFRTIARMSDGTRRQRTRYYCPLCEHWYGRKGASE